MNLLLDSFNCEFENENNYVFQIWMKYVLSTGKCYHQLYVRINQLVFSIHGVLRCHELQFAIVLRKWAYNSSVGSQWESRNVSLFSSVNIFLFSPWTIFFVCSRFYWTNKCLFFTVNYFIILRGILFLVFNQEIFNFLFLTRNSFLPAVKKF